MTIPGVNTLIAWIINAVTFELFVHIPIRFLVNSGPWATSIGVLITLSFVTACIVYAFVCKMNKDRLVRALVTLFRYLLSWIGLRLLWRPGNRLSCFLATKLFSRRCHRLQFLNSVQLVFVGLCLYAALHRAGLTRELLGYWRRTPIYRCFYDCQSNAVVAPVVNFGMDGGFYATPLQTSRRQQQQQQQQQPLQQQQQQHQVRRSTRTPKPKQFTCC